MLPGLIIAHRHHTGATGTQTCGSCRASNELLMATRSANLAAAGGAAALNEFGTPHAPDRRSPGDLEFVANVENPQGHPRCADHGVVFGPGMDVAGQRDHIVLGV